MCDVRPASADAAQAGSRNTNALNKIIVTGANGVGKRHFAARLAEARPEIPLVSFDAIKLLTDWQQKPRPEIDAILSETIERDAWILEGGPSLLFQAVPKADALVWLDPPEYVRAWQLLSRPWKFRGRTRPELPPGNVDWPLQQYTFALRSLRKRSMFRDYIADVFETSEGLRKWQCRSEPDRAEVLTEWSSFRAV